VTTQRFFLVRGVITLAGSFQFRSASFEVTLRDPREEPDLRRMLQAHATGNTFRVNPGQTGKPDRA
jgi:hypothetical protein